MCMRRRGEHELCAQAQCFELSAQARWFCKLVGIHCACHRKRTDTLIIQTDGNLTLVTGKSGGPTRGRTLFNMRGPGFATKAFGTQVGRVSDSSRTLPGHSSDASRALLGRLPDAPRTPPGRSSDVPRTAPNRAVVSAHPVVFSNSVCLG